MALYRILLRPVLNANESPKIFNKSSDMNNKDRYKKVELMVR